MLLGGSGTTRSTGLSLGSAKQREFSACLFCFVSTLSLKLPCRSMPGRRWQSRALCRNHGATNAGMRLPSAMFRPLLLAHDSNIQKGLKHKQQSCHEHGKTKSNRHLSVVSVYRSIYVSCRLSIDPSDCLFTYLSIYLKDISIIYIYIYTHIHVYIFNYLSVCLCLSIDLPIYLSLSIYRSICLSIGTHELMYACLHARIHVCRYAHVNGYRML